MDNMNENMDLDAKGFDNNSEEGYIEERRRSAEQTLARIAEIRTKRQLAGAAATVASEPAGGAAAHAEPAKAELKRPVAQPAYVPATARADASERSVDTKSQPATVQKAPVAYPQYIYAIPQAPHAPATQSTKSRVEAVSRTNGFTKKRGDDVNIKDVIGIFIPKLWIIAVCAVIIGIILGGYAMFFKADTYTSKATFIVSTHTSISETDLKLSDKMIGILDVQISTSKFLAEVATKVNEDYKSAGWKVSEKELARSVSLARVQDDAPAFTVSVTTNDPKKSLAIAETLTFYMEKTKTETGESVAPIEGFLPPSYSKVSITEIESPSIGSANDKGVATKVVVGCLVGAVVSMVVIYMFAMFDVIIHDRKKLEDNFDIPVLGVIPRFEAFADEMKGGSRK